MLGIAFAASLWQVYLFLLLLGTFSAIFYPAKSGVLRQIITENQIQAAVSTSEMINNSAKIIGPAAGGALISFIGIKGAFYLDVLSFLHSALLLTGIKVPKLEARAETGSSESPSITEGLRYIMRFPVLKIGLIVLCSMMLALQISDSQVMILLKEIKHATINFAGWCIAASGIGMLAASAIFTKIKIGEKLTALIFSPAILGAGFIAVSIGTGWPTGIIKIVFPCIFFLMGFSFTMAIIPFDVMVQKKTPETHTGRVFGAINSASTLAVLTGILAGGGLSEWLGVGITFQISGGASCLLALITLIAIRKIERKNPDVTEGIERTS
ncbi:MFS transporter [Heyndrickxia acidiproducens]|uniref:MFS transporter n=1 Tax=Heyndrickxia acidiproducens TaxID=1121084 RepID=UPI0003A38EA8|nr:MFS transporter [Heyndrickxia acidiproducens]